MKKISLIVLIALITFLAACAPQVTASPEPTVTPPPTATILPTPTFHPEFMALQELISNSGARFTLRPDGMIEDGADAISGLRVSTDGVMTLTLADGTVVTLDSSAVSFDDEKGFGVEGYELDENGKWVEAEVRQFPECNFADFKSCPVAIEDTSAKQDYVRSLVTPEMFNLADLKYTKMSTYKTPYGTLMTPDVETAPNYTGANAERAPFIKDNNWNGVTEVDGVTHAVVNTPYVVEDGKGGYKVIVMTGFRPMKGGGYDVANVDEFNNRMNIIPWRIDSQSIELATRFVNPATGENFTTEEVSEIIEEMRQGNFANADGLVLYFQIGRSSGGWWE